MLCIAFTWFRPVFFCRFLAGNIHAAIFAENNGNDNNRNDDDNRNFLFSRSGDNGDRNNAMSSAGGEGREEFVTVRGHPLENVVRTRQHRRPRTFYLPDSQRKVRIEDFSQIPEAAPPPPDKTELQRQREEAERLASPVAYGIGAYLRCPSPLGLRPSSRLSVSAPATATPRRQSSPSGTPRTEEREATSAAGSFAVNVFGFNDARNTRQP